MSDTVQSPLGIKETREALKAGLAVIVVAAKFSQHKPQEAYAGVVAAVTSLPAAIENAAEIPAEVKDFDAAEIEILVNDVREQLPNIVSDKALKIANIAITIGLSIARGVIEAKNL